MNDYIGRFENAIAGPRQRLKQSRESTTATSATATAPPPTPLAPPPAEAIVGEIRKAHARGWAMTTLQGKAAIRKGWQSESPPVPLDQLIKHAKAGDNIGIRTGPASGVVVIDVDDLDAEVRLTDTVTANTGGGGRHYFYRCPESVRIGNSADDLGLPAGVHVRGAGGYVVMPGSTHPDTGARYAWASDRSPDDIELAPLPDELLARAVESQRTAKREPQPAQTRTAEPQPGAPESGPPLPPPPPPVVDSTASWVAAALDNETTAVASAPEGQRNHTLNRAAFNLGQIVGGGALSRSEAEHALWSAAEACGLEHGEIAKTLRSGLNAGVRKPRTKPERERKPATRGAQQATATPPGKPLIQIGTDEHRMVDEAIPALAADPGLFYRGHELVRVLRTLEAGEGTVQKIIRPEGAATIASVPGPNLRERLSKYADFEKFDKRANDWRPANVPGTLPSMVAARGQWPNLREIIGVSDAPVLRPDGTLHQTPGYDRATRVLYEPADELDFAPIPEGVTIDDAQAAVDDLLEPVTDFPLLSDAHRSAWIAAVLTMLGRFAFTGPAPLFLIDANQRGSGKTLLAQLVGLICTGHTPPVTSYAHDVEEMRKLITAIAIAGDRMVQLDNIEGRFGNAALDRALTSTHWRDRILGKSEQVSLPLLPVWIGTGNNCLLSADVARRVIHVRLEWLEGDNPEEREGFKHPDLVDWTKRNRGRLLRAALTILVAYCNNDRPDQQLKPFGSFEGWSGLVRQAVVWAGLPDPCETRATLAAEADEDTENLRQFIQAWRQFDDGHDGMVLAPLIDRLYKPDPSTHVRRQDEASVMMREAIEQLLDLPSGREPTARKLGYKLRQFKRRPVDGFYLDAPKEKAKRGQRWTLTHIR